MRIVYRGVYAGFPAAGLHTGDLAYATDLVVLYFSNGTAWIPYHDYPDYQGEKAGVYLEPEWAAREGRDRLFTMLALNQTFGMFAGVTYIVPVGRTLYITYISVYCGATNAADADNNQMVHLVIFTPDVLTRAIRLGGNGGFSMVLIQPLVIQAGVFVSPRIYARANHAVDMSFSVGGYEI